MKRKITVHISFMDDNFDDVEQLTFDKEFDNIEEASKYQEHIQELFEKYKDSFSIGLSIPVTDEQAKGILTRIMTERG